MRCMTRLKLFTTWIDKVMADIRELIFQKNGSDKVTAGIYTDSDGIVSGIPAALKRRRRLGFLSPTQCMKVKRSLPGICSWSFPECPPRSVQRRTASSVRSPNIPAWPRRREHSAVRSAAGRRSFAAPGKNARRNQKQTSPGHADRRRLCSHVR